MTIEPDKFKMEDWDRRRNTALFSGEFPGHDSVLMRYLEGKRLMARVGY